MVARFLLLFVVLAGASLSAVELPVDLGFGGAAAADGLPRNWTVHTYEGYMPKAETAVADDPAFGKVLHYSAPRGRSGAAIRSVARMRGKAGDVVTVRLRAKGTGEAWFSLYCWTEEEWGWVCALGARTIALSDGWKEFSYDFMLRDSATAKTAQFEVALGLKPGGDAYFADVRVSRSLETERMVDFDGFETAVPRTGTPRIGFDILAPGLLEKTHTATYETDGTVELLAPRDYVMPSADGRSFLSHNVRIYGFGRSRRTSSRLETEIGIASNRLSFVVLHDESSDMLECTLSGRGRTLGTLQVPYSALPADFVLSANPSGIVDLAVTSLADSGTLGVTVRSDVFCRASGSVSKTIRFSSTGGRSAEVTVDNLSAAVSSFKSQKEMECPYAAKPETVFDPVASGWPLVFSDEFDGVSIDERKWELPLEPWKRDYAALSGDGRLMIKGDFIPGTKKLATASLHTRETFLYGYFESRVKFTRQSGWWSAFWLCSHGIGNPFIDGFEIDIFEDYYTRVRTPGEKHPKTLDHNLHVKGAGVMKSYNYNSTLPGSLDDFYVIGCKWTPFEITLYLNGHAIASRASHSPYSTVTFDAFRHGTCIAPLHVIVSGQIMNDSWTCCNTEGFRFPEFFEVDYVRVYSHPGSGSGARPEVLVKSSAQGNFSMRPGGMISFSGDATPSSQTLSPIRALHLFDDGYWLGSSKTPSHTFVLPFTDSHFAKTAWMRPGRSGERPQFEGSLHAFSVFAEDADGAVSFSKPILLLSEPTKASSPYCGSPQRIPGTVVAGRYDEGGQGVAYYDTTVQNVASTAWRTSEGVDGSEHTIGSVSTGEWLRYTVDVAQAGDYRLTFTYGTPSRMRHGVMFLCDGRKIGELSLRAHDNPTWASDTADEIVLRLPEGRHVLTVLLFGQFNFQDMVFCKED